MNRPPYTGQRVHPNSIEAFRALDIPVRWRAVFEVYFRLYPKYLTDRQVLYHITGSYSGDMNKVRPRITEMILEKTIPLQEMGYTKCRITEKRVRVVGLAVILPKPCKIPEPIGDLTPPVEEELHRLYAVVQPGQQTLDLASGSQEATT